MLADGKQLIMQVMPSALLQQTKDVMKSCFSTSILPKKVFTLEFERSVEDSAEFVSKLYAKLNDARKGGSVCAAPEAIKSLALKFVEHLHSIEEFDTSLLVPGSSVRENEIALDMKDKMIAKSDMADSLIKVLDMWKKGVLIMDEVDVLLHPLRSELNFPIGHKYPIDLSDIDGTYLYIYATQFFTQKQENSLMHLTYKLLKACKLITKRFLKG